MPGRSAGYWRERAIRLNSITSVCNGPAFAEGYGGPLTRNVSTTPNPISRLFLFKCLHA